MAIKNVLDVLRLSKIEEGETVTFKDGETDTVKKACDNKTNGYWFCTNCKEPIANMVSPEEHGKMRGGHHRLAWMCWQHGVEQP